MINIRDANDKTEWKRTGACLGQATALGHAWIKWAFVDSDTKLVLAVNDKPALRISITGPKLVVEQAADAATNESIAACLRTAGIVEKYDELLEAHNQLGALLNSGRQFIIKSKAKEDLEAREEERAVQREAQQETRRKEEAAQRKALAESLDKLLLRIESAEGKDHDRDLELSTDIITGLICVHGPDARKFYGAGGVLALSLDRIAELQQAIFPGAFIGVSFDPSASRYRAVIQHGPADGATGYGATEHFARLAAIVRGARDNVLASCEKMERSC